MTGPTNVNNHCKNLNIHNTERNTRGPDTIRYVESTVDVSDYSKNEYDELGKHNK